MDGFWKCAAGLLVAVILWLTVDSRQKDLSVLLTLAACSMGGMVVIGYLEPVLDLMRWLQNLGQLDEGMLGILLKAAGIGLTGEFAAMVCCDAGNAAMGKMLRMLGCGAILWLSVPMVQSLMTLIQEILGML